MKIAEKTVAGFHYTLRNDAGEELETSRNGDASVYLHGAGNIIPGLEKALAGRSAGDVFTVEVAPEDAYGELHEDSEQRVPISHLLFKGKLRKGDVAQLNTAKGRLPVKVVKVGRHSATIDTNHPLAGQTLTFDIEVIEVRAAEAEELAHGHAHGPGGHQH